METNVKPQKKTSLGAKMLIGFVFLFIINKTLCTSEKNTDNKTEVFDSNISPSNTTTELNQAEKDSIDKINKAEEERNAKVFALERKKWENSKPGKIQKKHPDWSDDDCERVANREIWIGMSLS